MTCDRRGCCRVVVLALAAGLGCAAAIESDPAAPGGPSGGTGGAAASGGIAGGENNAAGLPGNQTAGMNAALDKLAPLIPALRS